MLNLFVEILTTVTLPIVALLGVGWALQPWLKLDVGSLSRLLVNLVLPCALLHFLTTAELPLREVWPTAWFTVIQFVVLTALGWGAAALFRLPQELRPVIGLTMSFANTGNFGIPVAQLAFQPDFLLHQTVIVSLHSIMIVLAGVLILAGRRGNLLESLQALVTSPMILAVVLGLVLKGFDAELPYVVAYPVEIVSGAYIALALFTLGAQLAGTRSSLSSGGVWLAVGLKMLLAPGLSWAALWALGLAPELSDLLVVATAAPVGLLLAIFCTEYKRAPDLAGTAVLATTAISPLSVTVWIMAVRLL